MLQCRVRLHVYLSVSLCIILSVTYVLWLNGVFYRKTTKKQIGNGLWGIEWSRDVITDDMTLKDSAYDPNVLS